MVVMIMTLVAILCEQRLWALTLLHAEIRPEMSASFLFFPLVITIGNQKYGNGRL